MTFEESDNFAIEQTSTDIMSCWYSRLLLILTFLLQYLSVTAWTFPLVHVQRKFALNQNIHSNSILRQRGCLNRLSRKSASSQRYMSVEAITFENLSSNHDVVGQDMADSLQRMLDTEWMPQDIHVKMARRVKESYIKCRTSDEAVDIMTIMTTVADDLTAHWTEYDKDAFVNAWDIANYVSDYLTTKAGGESCGCTSKIY